MATLPADNPGFCGYGKCKGISLSLSYRHYCYDHFFWKNHTGPLFSSANLQKNATFKYNISRNLILCPGRRNYFYDYENDNIIHEKYKKRIFILSLEQKAAKPKRRRVLVEILIYVIGGFLTFFFGVIFVVLSYPALNISSILKN